MGAGTSIILIAVGAILDFAVKVQTTAVNLKTIGLILMVVGAIGLVVSLFFWGSWGGFGGSRRTTRVRTTEGAAVDTDGRRYRLRRSPATVDYVEEEQRF